MASKFFVNQRACRFYTAGCVNKMEVSVTGPRAVNELGCPVIPGKFDVEQQPSLYITAIMSVCPRTTAITL